MPDFGTSRCDSPGGDACTLCRSIQKVLPLPDETCLFLCHNYEAPEREEFQHETSVGEQREHNFYNAYPRRDHHANP